MSEATGVGAPGAADESGPGGGAAGGMPAFLTHKQIMIVLPGLLMTMLLAMLDQLVVGTALPRIVGDLGGVSHLSWVVTAYILTSTITTPFYGKLGDMYGRKKLFIFAIVVFLVGSALSGLASSMDMLIAFRALQGLGAGGLIVGAMSTLGEIVPPRERGKYMSYFMVVMMLATVGGPLVGGWITQAISWRWIFYINLPLGGAALVYLMATLKLPARRVEHRIDYLGGILLGVVATAIILVATWGGTEYSWGSLPVVLLIAVAVVAFAAFITVERRAAEPMLPLHVFKIRNFSLSMGLAFFVGLGLFGAMTFIPLYQQTVQGASPTVSGLLMTPMMVGSAVTSVLAGVLTTKTGRYKLFPIVGGAVMAVGMGLLTGLSVTTTRWETGDLLRGPRPRHGPADADGLADRAEQRGAQGHGRGDERPDVLPADGRLARRGRVRRAVREPPDLGDERGGLDRGGAGLRRVVRPGAGDVPPARGAAGRVPRGRARRAGRVLGGPARVDRGLRPRPVHQGSAAARPGGAGRGSGPGPGGRGADRLAAQAQRNGRPGGRPAAGRPFVVGDQAPP